jgi:hypothetical protein
MTASKPKQRRCVSWVEFPKRGGFEHLSVGIMNRIGEMETADIQCQCQLPKVRYYVNIEH